MRAKGGDPQAAAIADLNAALQKAAVRIALLSADAQCDVHIRYHCASYHSFFVIGLLSICHSASVSKLLRFQTTHHLQSLWVWQDQSDAVKATLYSMADGD